MEPPDHTRVRRLVSKAFTPRMVEGLRPRVERIVDELVDGVRGRGRVRPLPAIAEPLPVTVIAEMLGVPEADRHLLRPWSADICGMYELEPLRAVAARRRPRRASSSPSTCASSAASDGARPGDDLITALAQVARRGRHAHRGRADRHVRAAAERRPRGHGERDRQRLVGAVPQPRRSWRRSAADPSLLPTARRGADAVRHAAADVRALGAGGPSRSAASRSRGAPSSACCSARRTTTRRSSTDPTSSTSAASRTRT